MGAEAAADPDVAAAEPDVAAEEFMYNMTSRTLQLTQTSLARESRNQMDADAALERMQVERDACTARVAEMRAAIVTAHTDEMDAGQAVVDARRAAAAMVTAADRIHDVTRATVAGSTRAHATAVRALVDWDYRLLGARDAQRQSRTRMADATAAVADTVATQAREARALARLRADRAADEADRELVDHRAAMAASDAAGALADLANAGIRPMDADMFPVSGADGAMLDCRSTGIFHAECIDTASDYDERCP